MDQIEILEYEINCLDKSVDHKKDIASLFIERGENRPKVSEHHELAPSRANSALGLGRSFDSTSSLCFNPRCLMHSTNETSPKPSSKLHSVLDYVLSSGRTWSNDPITSIEHLNRGTCVLVKF